MFRAFATFFEGWAIAADGAPGTGLEDMRRGVDLLREQNVLSSTDFSRLRWLRPRHARAIPTAPSPSSTKRWRPRTAPAIARSKQNCIGRGAKFCSSAIPRTLRSREGALLTAVAVAKQQGTRSFELRAALALAELYQSTGRPDEAHAVLAPAFEGFSPTSEMPEIAEAQALLVAIEAGPHVRHE